VILEWIGVAVVLGLVRSFRRTLGSDDRDQNYLLRRLGDTSSTVQGNEAVPRLTVYPQLSPSRDVLGTTSSRSLTVFQEFRTNLHCLQKDAEPHRV